MKYKFVMTKEHCEQGERNSETNCPVARAFKDALGNDYDVRVTGGRVKLTDKKTQMETELCIPLKVQEMIRDFDNSGVMTEITVDDDINVEFGEEHVSLGAYLHGPTPIMYTRAAA